MLRPDSTRQHGNDTRVGDDFVGLQTPDGTDRALGLVDFSIFPHIEHLALPHNTKANARKSAPALGSPAFAIDDETPSESSATTST